MEIEVKELIEYRTFYYRIHAELLREFGNRMKIRSVLGTYSNELYDLMEELEPYIAELWMDIKTTKLEFKCTNDLIDLLICLIKKKDVEKRDCLLSEDTLQDLIQNIKCIEALCDKWLEKFEEFER